jgi:hypothetical protein
MTNPTTSFRSFAASRIFFLWKAPSSLLDGSFHDQSLTGLLNPGPSLCNVPRDGYRAYAYTHLLNYIHTHLYTSYGTLSTGREGSDHFVTIQFAILADALTTTPYASQLLPLLKEHFYRTRKKVSESYHAKHVKYNHFMKLFKINCFML